LPHRFLPLFLLQFHVQQLTIPYIRCSAELPDTLPTARRPAPLAVAGKKGLADELKDRFHQLPLFSRKQADNILELFSVLTDYIVTKEIVSIKGNRSAGQILAFIEENLHCQVSVRNAAQAVGQSVSGISHQLKKATGKTFTQHLNEARVRRAEIYMKQSPELSIQEIATKLGYNDPFYFSRVYRNLRGFPPGQYRSSF
jgi:AraC-like DNA-binding protein